jgi:CrcB protein
MIWAVAIGGAMGSIARFLLGAFVQHRAGTTFPVGTLVINITGSLLLGFLLRFALSTPSITPATRALLTTGFCGGYTTFSTFSYETMALIEENELGRAALYVALSVMVALVGTYCGMLAAREILALRDGV